MSLCHLCTENKFLNTKALQSRIVGICVGQKASDRYVIIECNIDFPFHFIVKTLLGW